MKEQLDRVEARIKIVQSDTAETRTATGLSHTRWQHLKNHQKWQNTQKNN